LKFPKSSGEISPNTPKKTNLLISDPSKNLALENENKSLREKVKQLEEKNKDQEQTIINLKQ
jgi:hypothetical protein